jgi:hypothetical protein
MKSNNTVNQYIILLGIFIILGCFSCKKWVEVTAPGNVIESSFVFSNDQTATAAIAGLYTSMTNPYQCLFSGNISVYPGLSADELIGTKSSITDDPFITNTIATNSSMISGMWGNGYSYIYQANAMLEGLNNNQGVTPALKTQLMGEAKFIRAFSYFYLVNLFGAVPLETSTNYTVNATKARTDSAAIYQQIIADLQDAQQRLSPSYMGTGRIRVNQWAATALLARVYLYQDNWQGADSAASAVINAGVYSLETNLNNVFLVSSKEAIWQLQPSSPSLNTGEGYLLLPSSATALPTYVLNPFLLNAFEPGDKRMQNWTNSTVVAGQKYTYAYKYKVWLASALTEYSMVLRLAELYLIRAEARAHLDGNLPGAVADLNTIRTRAGLPETTASDQVAVLSAIARENKVEFFAEFGHRWLDLKRTGTINTILGAPGNEKSSWQAYQALYPIPLAEIQKNAQLQQNLGYH